MNKYTILKTIVGSQAHGLADEKSDFDYRGVFVVPTTEILSLGAKLHETDWMEGNEDNTAWEIGHFLNMAVHCNPTVLETFLAPIAPMGAIESDNPFVMYGEQLRALFPHVWNSKDVMNAFIGYGVNQRKKFFDNKDNRAPKYAVAYLRVLYQAAELLSTGTFTIKLSDTSIGTTLKRWKKGDFTHGEVIEECFKMETEVLKAFKQHAPKETNIEPVNDFLLKVRKDFWE